MLLQNEDEFDFQLIFPHTNRFLCKNHTQNVSEFRSEKKLVCVWLLLLLRLYMRLCLCEFMRECGNSRRNSLFVVLLFAIFSFRRCRVVAWLRSNLNFLRFCFGCSTHKRAHIYIYTTQRRTCVLSVLFYREGKARRKKACCVYIHRTEQLTFFALTELLLLLTFCSFQCLRTAVNGKKVYYFQCTTVFSGCTLNLNFFLRLTYIYVNILLYFR